MGMKSDQEGRLVKRPNGKDSQEPSLRDHTHSWVTPTAPVGGAEGGAGDGARDLAVALAGFRSQASTRRPGGFKQGLGGQDRAGGRRFFFFFSLPYGSLRGRGGIHSPKPVS